MSEAGIHGPFVQDNHSRSNQNVLRGLHYQVQHPQGKLVRVVHGRVFDVAVDLRKQSTHFGEWFATVLDGESLRMLWIPPGFAHGYLVLSDSADFLYKTTDFYFPADQHTISYNDSQIGIDWPGDPKHYLLSDKDKEGTPLASAQVYP